MSWRLPSKLRRRRRAKAQPTLVVERGALERLRRAVAAGALRPK